MIYVGPLARRDAPWEGGVAALMISDVDLLELRAMGQQIRLPAGAVQDVHRGWVWHLIVSPGQRRRAVKFGATSVDNEGFVRAALVARKKGMCDAPKSWRARRVMA